MRHAKSDWNNELISDFDRPLNNRGLADAPRMAQWVESEKLFPDLLISSPALRARQTTEAIIHQLDLDKSAVIFDKRLYLASVDILLAVIREIDNQLNRVMLVGHNPGLENLSMHLSEGKLPIAQDGSLMTTANIIQLRVRQNWHHINSCKHEFVRIMRPNQLS